MDITRSEIQQLKEEISSLEKQLSQKEIISDSDKLQKLSKELQEKKDEFELKSEVMKQQKALKDTQNLEKEENDEEMKKLAADEVKSIQNKLKGAQKALKNFFTEGEENKHKACIVEIRAGTGGEEAGLFASDLMRMYIKYAENRGWKVSLLSKNQTGKGGLKEVIFQIDGKGAFSNLQFESGVHRVQRVPTTESSGRIHTSAASVVVYPMVEEKEVKINPQNIKIDVYRSSGPGGQSVNTTDSAVRITHIPTNTTVTCQDEKSQHKNKKKALSLLQSKLADKKQSEQEDDLSEIRKSAIKTGDRSAKVRTYNFPQSRVTDHRIKKSWHNLESILNGDIDQIIKALQPAS